MRTLFKVILILVLSKAQVLLAQSISIEAGGSKHFLSNTEKIIEPNFQINYSASSSILFLLSYYHIDVYWPFEFMLLQNKEVLTGRDMHGIDLSIDIPSLFSHNISGIFIGIGPSYRHRVEYGNYYCDFTSAGWSECFGFIKLDDFGVNFIADYDYYFWKNFGVSASANYRIYDRSVSLFSLNAGIVYKINL